MKKFLTTFLFTCLLCMLSITPIHASSNDYVIDETGYFSHEYITELNEKCEHLSNEYNCAIYIRIVGNTTSSTIENLADNTYLSENLGKTSDHSGVMLYLDPINRHYDVVAHGEGNKIFTDYGKDEMAQHFVIFFANDNFEDGIKTFINEASNMIEDYYNYGDIIDVNNTQTTHSDALYNLKMDALGALVLTLLVMFALSTLMKNKGIKLQADQYEKGGLNLRHTSNLYTHTTTSRQYAPHNKNNGGGGTSVRSSGSSHSSGSF